MLHVIATFAGRILLGCLIFAISGLSILTLGPRSINPWFSPIIGTAQESPREVADALHFVLRLKKALKNPEIEKIKLEGDEFWGELRDFHRRVLYPQAAGTIDGVVTEEQREQFLQAELEPFSRDFVAWKESSLDPYFTRSFAGIMWGDPDLIDKESLTAEDLELVLLLESATAAGYQKGLYNLEAKVNILQTYFKVVAQTADLLIAAQRNKKTKGKLDDWHTGFRSWLEQFEVRIPIQVWMEFMELLYQPHTDQNQVIQELSMKGMTKTGIKLHIDGDSTDSDVVLNLSANYILGRQLSLQNHFDQSVDQQTASMQFIILNTLYESYYRTHQYLGMTFDIDKLPKTRGKFIRRLKLFHPEILKESFEERIEQDRERNFRLGLLHILQEDEELFSNLQVINASFLEDFYGEIQKQKIDGQHDYEQFDSILNALLQQADLSSDAFQTKLIKKLQTFPLPYTKILELEGGKETVARLLRRAFWFSAHETQKELKDLITERFSHQSHFTRDKLIRITETHEAELKALQEYYERMRTDSSLDVDRMDLLIFAQKITDAKKNYETEAKVAQEAWMSGLAKRTVPLFSLIDVAINKLTFRVSPEEAWMSVNNSGAYTRASLNKMASLTRATIDILLDGAAVPVTEELVEQNPDWKTFVHSTRTIHEEGKTPRQVTTYMREVPGWLTEYPAVGRVVQQTRNDYEIFRSNLEHLSVATLGYPVAPPPPLNPDVLNQEDESKNFLSKILHRSWAPIQHQVIPRLKVREERLASNLSPLLKQDVDYLDQQLHQHYFNLMEYMREGRKYLETVQKSLSFMSLYPVLDFQKSLIKNNPQWKEFIDFVDVPILDANIAKAHQISERKHEVTNLIEEMKLVELDLSAYLNGDDFLAKDAAGYRYSRHILDVSDRLAKMSLDFNYLAEAIIEYGKEQSQAKGGAQSDTDTETETVASSDTNSGTSEDSETSQASNSEPEEKSPPQESPAQEQKNIPYEAFIDIAYEPLSSAQSIISNIHHLSILTHILMTGVDHIQKAHAHDRSGVAYANLPFEKWIDSADEWVHSEYREIEQNQFIDGFISGAHELGKVDEGLENDHVVQYQLLVKSFSTFVTQQLQKEGAKDITKFSELPKSAVNAQRLVMQIHELFKPVVSEESYALARSKYYEILGELLGSVDQSLDENVSELYRILDMGDSVEKTWSISLQNAVDLRNITKFLLRKKYRSKDELKKIKVAIREAIDDLETTLNGLIEEGRSKLSVTNPEPTVQLAISSQTQKNLQILVSRMFHDGDFKFKTKKAWTPEEVDIKRANQDRQVRLLKELVRKNFENDDTVRLAEVEAKIHELVLKPLTKFDDSEGKSSEDYHRQIDFDEKEKIVLFASIGRLFFGFDRRRGVQDNLLISEVQAFTNNPELRDAYAEDYKKLVSNSFKELTAGSQNRYDVRKVYHDILAMNIKEQRDWGNGRFKDEDRAKVREYLKPRAETILRRINSLIIKTSRADNIDQLEESLGEKISESAYVLEGLQKFPTLADKFQETIAERNNGDFVDKTLEAVHHGMNTIFYAWLIVKGAWLASAGLAKVKWLGIGSKMKPLANAIFGFNAATDMFFQTLFMIGFAVFVGEIIGDASHSFGTAPDEYAKAYRLHHAALDSHSVLDIEDKTATHEAWQNAKTDFWWKVGILAGSVVLILGVMKIGAMWMAHHSTKVIRETHRRAMDKAKTLMDKTDDAVNIHPGQMDELIDDLSQKLLDAKNERLVLEDALEAAYRAKAEAITASKDIDNIKVFVEGIPHLDDAMTISQAEFILGNTKTIIEGLQYRIRDVKEAVDAIRDYMFAWQRRIMEIERLHYRELEKMGIDMNARLKLHQEIEFAYKSKDVEFFKKLEEAGWDTIGGALARAEEKMIFNEQHYRLWLDRQKLEIEFKSGLIDEATYQSQKLKLPPSENLVTYAEWADFRKAYKSINNALEREKNVALRLHVNYFGIDIKKLSKELWKVAEEEAIRETHAHIAAKSARTSNYIKKAYYWYKSSRLGALRTRWSVRSQKIRESYQAIENLMLENSLSYAMFQQAKINPFKHLTYLEEGMGGYQFHPIYQNMAGNYRRSMNWMEFASEKPSPQHQFIGQRYLKETHYEIVETPSHFDPVLNRAVTVDIFEPTVTFRMAEAGELPLYHDLTSQTEVFEYFVNGLIKYRQVDQLGGLPF